MTGAKQTNDRVFIRYEHTASTLEIVVPDEGPGLSNPANLFVPFFTTKRGGSGIGLVLSRQIIDPTTALSSFSTSPTAPAAKPSSHCP